MKTINLTLEGDTWYATWLGPDRDRIVALFGTATIATPFRAGYDRADLKRHILRRNPGYDVVVQNGSAVSPSP